MATEITISYGDKVLLDQSGDTFEIRWAEKGNAFPDIGNDVHYVIYNTIAGPNEVQRKDPSTQMMIGNTPLESTSSVVGNSVKISDLLTWAETRKGQIESAQLDFDNYFENAQTKWVDDGNNAEDFYQGNSATDSYIDWSKSWIDYDSNYS
jgi:hypothetical protein|tara:strand:- start:3070 stop:3522 length:453 start_codon:yes stop_codon:yes gene_type:complete